MAGDTPTPMYNNKAGTPLLDGEGFDLRLARENLVPQQVIDERRRVEKALMSTASTAQELQPEPTEYKYPPTRPLEIAPLAKQLIAARLSRLEAPDVLAKWDTAA